jgi:hypothetical protein
MIRISASFGPSAVRVNTETVYSGRREADVVMASTVQVDFRQFDFSGYATPSKFIREKVTLFGSSVCCSFFFSTWAQVA